MSSGRGAWLVTAFEPYLGPTNATQELLRSLEESCPPELRSRRERLAFRVLPVCTRRLRGALQAALDEVRPEGVVLLGQAPARGRVEVERRAVNRLDFERPDNSGARPRGEPIEPGGPEALGTSLPDPEGAAAALVAAGLPGGTSDDCGQYLCNQAFYLARRIFSGPAGFVHVPVLKEQRSPDDDGPSLDLASQRRALAILLSRWVPEGRPGAARGVA